MRKIDPEKQLAKRRQIVDAAIVCFAKQGFHATSTAQICAQAGMSPGNLFHYFPTKNAIIQSIAEMDRSDTIGVMQRLEASDDVVVGLQNLAKEALIAASDPIYSAISIEIAAEAIRNPAVAALFADNDDAARRAMIRHLKRGVESGQIDSCLDLTVAASWLLALIEGGVGRVAMEQGFSVDSHFPALAIIIERFLRPRS